jgi:foldase protein PrsA
MLGYYVFEVKRVIPAEQKPLSQVEASIRQTLPAALYQSALGAFVASWRKRWRARTDCEPGYVVSRCNGATPEAEGPYDLG